MAQITIYLPDELARRLRREAKRAGKSLSLYLAELAGGARRSGEWPAEFWALQGACKGSLTLPEDPPPEEPDAL